MGLGPSSTFCARSCSSERRSLQRSRPAPADLAVPTSGVWRHEWQTPSRKAAGAAIPRVDTLAAGAAFTPAGPADARAW